MANPLRAGISVNSLIEGFRDYAKTTCEILRHPFTFPQRLHVEGKKAFADACSFALYAIVLMFFMHVPIFSMFSADVSKVGFLIEDVVSVAILCVLLHVTLRIVGRSKKSLRATAVVYLYAFGVWSPLISVIFYPLALVIGPQVLFGSLNDVGSMAFLLQQHPNVVLYLLIVYPITFVFLLWVLAAWFKRTHQVSRPRIVFCIVLAGLATLSMTRLALEPVLQTMLESIEQWLKYA
jgi:hypothetical protein